MEIYERSEDEGRRRLSMSALELTSTRLEVLDAINAS
jgi:hypothetical protein